MTINLSEMQRSALLEAGNIGSGHAAIALSQLMARKIMIAIPSIEVVSFDGFNSMLSDSGKKYAMVSLSVVGDIKGTIFFIIEEKMAYLLCDVVMGQLKGTTQGFDQLEKSFYKEVGNILSTAYLGAVCEMVGMSTVVTTPDFDFGERDIFRKVLSKKNISDKEIDELMCIKTEFIESEEKIDGYLVFAPTGTSIRDIINALHV